MSRLAPGPPGLPLIGHVRDFQLLPDGSLIAHVEREPDGDTTAGPGIELEIPLFDRGQADYAYAIFTYLTLEVWARAFLDKPTVAIDGPCAAVDAPAVDLQPV